jgi:CRP-like cAMP-binding protein
MAQEFTHFKEICQIRLFSGMSRTDLQEIAHMTRIQKVKKHQPVYQAGEPDVFVYLLLDGWVKVHRGDARGREVVLDLLQAGDVFGEMHDFGRHFHDATAEAVADSRIGAITKVDFASCLRKYENLAMALVRLIGERLQEAQQRVEDFVFHTVQGRLARLLLKYYKVPGATDCLPSYGKLTHQEMAYLIGCSRETVSAVLGQFRDDGLVYYHHRTITGVDERRLTRLLHNSHAAHPALRQSLHLLQPEFSTVASNPVRHVPCRPSPTLVRASAAQ